MTKQNIQSEEQFMHFNAWLSLLLGLNLFLLNIYKSIGQHNSWVLMLTAIVFVSSIILYFIKFGFKSVKTHWTFKDEFLNFVNAKALMHSSYGLMTAFACALLLNTNILEQVSHATMATIYMGVACIVYGISALWQTRN